VSTLRINIAELKREVGRRLSVRVQGTFAPEDGAPVPCEAAVRLTNLGEAIAVEGQVTTVPRLTCSRCLETFEYPLAVRLDEEFSEHPDEDAFGYAGEVLDLGEAVRQALELALPMRAVCREDCRGLCPSCGHNLNQGPCGCSA
jgi:uncharacterized protein